MTTTLIKLNLDSGDRWVYTLLMNRKEKLVPGGFYHIFNRGVEKRNIYTSIQDYRRFKNTLFHYLISNKKFSDENPSTETLNKFNLDKAVAEGFKKPVEVICYCLMPNHFHLLLKQLTEIGITDYLHQVTTSYTRHFNLKYERVGGLLQGTFKSRRIDSEEQLVYVSKYIHRNPIDSNKIGLDWKEALTYPWSSLGDYSKRESGLVLKDPVLTSFKSPRSYLNFVAEDFEEKELIELTPFDKNSNRVFS